MIRPGQPSQNDIQRLRSLQRRADEVGARRDSRIDTYLNLLERDPQSCGVAHVLAHLIEAYAAEQRLSPNLLAAPPNLQDLYSPQSLPDVLLGVTTETGVPWGPRMHLDCGSLFVTGISGGGKTTLILNLVVGAIQKLSNTAILILDVKGDFTCVTSIPHPSINVVRPRTEAPMQIVRPPYGVSLDAWLPRLATSFCEYRGLKKSRHLFLDTIRHLCVHFGVDVDPTLPWPSLFNVLDYLKNQRGSKFGKDAEYKASLINELLGLLEDTGRAFDTCDGVDVEDHLLKSGGIAVLQMEDLPAPAQQLISTLSIERIIARRVAAHVHNVPLQVLIILDEAQQVLSRKSDLESAHGVAPLAMQWLRARESGVGFLAATHMLSETSLSVLASAKTMVVAGGLSDRASIDTAAQMMNLPAQARTMFPRLGRGQGLVREIGHGAYTDAFLVDFDPPLLAKDAVSEAQRRAQMAPFLAGLPVTPSKPLTDYPALMAELHVASGKSPPASTRSAGATTVRLTREEEDLLLDCMRYRDDWMKERRSRLNISDYKALLRQAQSLEAQGLVRLHDVRLGRTTYSLVEVMDAGWQILGRSRPPHYIGHGGLLHTVLINRVARHLATTKWTRVQPEFHVGGTGHPVDIFGFCPAGVATAFEVTLSHSNVVSNAVRTLTPGSVVAALVFLCPVQDDCRKVEAILRRDAVVSGLMGQIQVRRVDQFIS